MTAAARRILRDELASGRALIGPLLQEIPTSADLVEFLGAAGFDFVIIDGEHAGVSVEACREMARAGPVRRSIEREGVR